MESTPKTSFPLRPNCFARISAISSKATSASRNQSHVGGKSQLGKNIGVSFLIDIKCECNSTNANVRRRICWIREGKAELASVGLELMLYCRLAIGIAQRVEEMRCINGKSMGIGLSLKIELICTVIIAQK